MLSPDGRCRPFSAAANGYVRGEGAGILLLKRLADAELDGDVIHGVILGSAENHCGKTASLTAPSSLAQAAVIREAILRAGVDPATITYVEAHGTGTPLGDPIEVKGLTNAFLGLGTSGQQWERSSCALGSIKGNIGHLELSAGIAGVIKVLLQMKHRTLAQSLYSDSPNTHIDFSQGPFHLVAQTQPWKARVDSEGKALPLRAGVSSFGFGGVNAHVVLEEYVSQGERDQDNEPSAQFIVLSADSESALKARAAQLVGWVDACTPTPRMLEQVAYTLQVGRKPMEFRMGFKAASFPELSEVLREYLKCGNVSSNDTFLHGRVSRQGEGLISQSTPVDALERWISGAEVDWPLLRTDQLSRRVSLPTYSFEGERFWPVARMTEPGTATCGASGGDGVVSALEVTVEPRQVRNSVAAKDALRGQVTQVLLDMAKSRGTSEYIDPDAEFGALGFDSLDMADLGLEIRGMFGFEVDTTAFFQHPTLSKLGHFIADTFSEVLVEHFSGTGSPQSMVEEGTSAAGSEGDAPEDDPLPRASASSGCSENSVAIVGMSGAFPMSPNLEHLWRNLLEGKDCIGRLPLVRRWGVSEDSVAVAHAGVLNETEQFDPLFFGISPREAEAMDPQQRLLMMHAWAAIEDSGHAPHSLSNERVGLIVGTGYSGYGTLLERAGTKVEGYSAAGMAAAMGPNRTSYFLNLRGPSEPVDTACSSSLVALHRAVQLIRSGECTSAVAGGVNTLISLDVQNSLAKAGMLSQEGRCKTFSSRADGYVRSEGVGMLYLKKLAAAERDGDSIYAVIKGSAVNHGGRTASLTAPSPLAQSEVVTEAIRNAAVDPATITYVEAHGTGTPLGDPVEISGLTQAFRETAVRELSARSCGIGSIKSNVGHLEMCAGVAGVIKVLLQMKHRTLVKSLHADELNGRIDFASSPFFVVREAVDWNRLKDPTGLELPLRAGVSSFGFGGVNAHVVLEEYLPSASREQNGVSRAVASGPLVATNGMTADAQVVERLRAKVADAVGMPVESISDMVPFSDYGVDSILVLDLTTRLEQEFGPLEKTVFFEYPTIKELAVHLARQQARPIARALVGTPPRNDVLGTRYSDIAVVGISGRYPKSPDLESFWNNLKQGMDCVEEIPNERWDWRGRSPRNRWGGFIEGVDQFDPLLFNISPRDAERIDPQERLFLQCAYAALEDAGYTPDEFGGAETAREVGVFVGVMYEEYQLYAVEAQARGIDVAVSGSAASVANRVSYSFNFRGPSMALDTMCSSSLTAIHLACQSIRNGDCRSAIAGGVNVSIHPNKYLLLSQARFESTEGRCASFGRGGNGYVPAEGVGVVVLKELATALKDGDHVYGVIRGSAINSGGRSQGYTAPNPDAQAAVIAAALRRADVDPRDISYVEAHGTGTHLGDPIEVAGLARAFTQPSARAESCAIGSVKSNIGHAEAAAGIAGFTKVLLQMKHRMLVPSIHSDELNPLIDFERTPFRVQRRAESWEPLSGLGTAKSLRRAAISSFGAGGANAHIVLEEYPEPMAGNAGEQSVVDVGSLFVLSARTEVQLQQSATRLREWLKTQSGEGVNLMDVAYTLQVGRVAREFRLGVVASRLPELLDGLSAYLEVELVDRPAGVLVGTAHPAGGSRGVEEQVFDEMVRTNRVGDLLAAWVEGADMPWRRWHSAARRRMSLPTYPFAKERYWIETGPAPVLQRASVPSLSVDAARPASAEVFDRIRELLASLLQVPIDALDGTRSLDAYGIDSILLMEFSDELANQFGIDLGSAELFLQPTIDQLVTHILSRVGDASTEAPQTGWNGDHSALQEGNRSCLGEFVGLRLLNTHHTPVAVFYPTHATPRAVRMGAFTLSVAVDAPPEPRVKGLIVICHGREGSQLMHHDLAERLASAGYIVAALEHPTDSWKDTSLADSPDFFSTRPREALQAIDAMLEHPHWQPLLRDLPIGIVAHSAGAIDALSLLGARVTVASASESASICRHVPGVINLPEEQSLPSASERLLTPDLKDSRIQGCVLLAPFTEPFDSSSLASVETPIRIYLAEKDETLDNGTNGYRAQKTLPRCEVVTLPALNHYSFIAPNGRIDPAGAGPREAPAPWSSEIVAFFHEHLGARGSAV